MGLDSQSNWPSLYSVDTLILSAPLCRNTEGPSGGYFRPAMLTSITFHAVAMLSAAGSSCLLVLHPSDVWTGPAALRTTGICEVHVSHLLGRQVGPGRGYLPPPPQTAAIDCKTATVAAPDKALRVAPAALFVTCLPPSTTPSRLSDLLPRLSSRATGTVSTPFPISRIRGLLEKHSPCSSETTPATSSRPISQ